MLSIGRFTPLEIMPHSSAAGLDFRIIPVGFNAPLGFESQRLEFLTGFTSGKEALEALNVQNFDLLLIDLEMPEMDGEFINPSYIDF